MTTAERLCVLASRPRKSLAIPENPVAHANRTVAEVEVVMSVTPAFPNVSKISYEGPKSKNPLAFKHYNASEKIVGKSMRDHLRFAVCYWHTFRNPLSDPFGVDTAIRPWDDGSNSIANAERRVRAAFEFI